jgi:cyclophilin family peptidyl-prolyl cis-trans isomerase
MISKLTPAILLGTLLIASPSFAQHASPIPSPQPSPHATPLVASPLSDMEAAAGTVLFLGSRLTFKTSEGNFTVVTFPKQAPKTVAQVIHLVESGFYDGLTFHRVIPGFVVQGGDPLSKRYPLGDSRIGRGGSGHSLPPEYQDESVKFLTGTLGMARDNSPNSADSQFFVTLAPKPVLDGLYTAWGQVIQGMDVFSKLHEGDRILQATVLKPIAPSPAPSARPTPPRPFS